MPLQTPEGRAYSNHTRSDLRILTNASDRPWTTNTFTAKINGSAILSPYDWSMTHQNGTMLMNGKDTMYTSHNLRRSLTATLAWEVDLEAELAVC